MERNEVRALDYLRQLQASIPYEGGVPEDLLRQRTKQVEGYADLVRTKDHSFEGDEKWLRENLILPFLACIPRHEARALHETPVGLLPIFEPNAWAVKTPSGDDLIVLHTELLAVLSFYSEAKGVHGEIHRRLGMEEATKFIRECFRLIFDSFLHKRKVDFPPLPVTLRGKAFEMVQIMTCLNELFIIAHEFAHIVLGHTGTVRVTPLKSIPGHKTVSIVTWEQQQELDADRKAMEWLHHLDKNSKSIYIKGAAFSPTMCAEVLMLLHFIEAHVGFPDSKASHPPALVRMEHLLSHAQEMLSDSDREHLAGMIRRANATRSLEL